MVGLLIFLVLLLIGYSAWHAASSCAGGKGGALCKAWHATLGRVF
jgi:hypothetical protein